jgi:hypothetical protein
VSVGHVAEDRQDVVVRPEEVAHLEAAERPVKPYERVAAGEDAGALGYRHAVLDLENRGNPVAEGLVAAIPNSDELEVTR